MSQVKALSRLEGLQERVVDCEGAPMLNDGGGLHELFDAFAERVHSAGQLGVGKVRAHNKQRKFLDSPFALDWRLFQLRWLKRLALSRLRICL